MSKVQKFARIAAATGVTLALQAHAVGVDVTSTVTTISDQLGPIGLIGVAVLGVTVAVKAFKWVRRGI